MNCRRETNVAVCEAYAVYSAGKSSLRLPLNSGNLRSQMKEHGGTGKVHRQFVRDTAQKSLKHRLNRNLSAISRARNRQRIDQIRYPHDNACGMTDSWQATVY
jgi:hypothetical protein